VIQYQQGAYREAEVSVRKAIAQRPDHAAAHADLSVVLRAAGKLDAAVAAYRDALRIRPKDSPTHFNLGNALADQGKLKEAATSYEVAVQLKPDFAEAYHHLGNVLARLGLLKRAVPCYVRALELKPEEVELIVDLGVAFLKLEKHQEAFTAFRRALQLRPDHVAALNNLSLVLKNTGQLDEAIKPLERAVAIDPGNAVIQSSLGTVLKDQGKLAAAAASFQKALGLRPDYAKAHYNLANTRLEQGQLDAAMAGYERAIELDPELADASYERACLWLLQGDFERGWPEYECRWQIRQAHRRGQLRRHDQWPLWDGGTLDGKSILLYAEQGFGDAFQFVRYAALVKERGGKVLLECDPRLIDLLSRCPSIDRLIPRGEEISESVDCQAPLMSLPGIFKTRANTIPAGEAYLMADPERVSRWRERLAACGGLRIGIAWQGSQEHARDRVRSISLAQFAPLATVPGVRLLSLQKGPSSRQVGELEGRFAVDDLAVELDEAAGGFVDTAAVMTSLDLVISSDTAIAHLAGGLGVPVWVALSEIPDWRWQLSRDDSPWYPTMRLFRQPDRGDWRGVFEAMAAALTARIAASK
jgi:tetratricopeptide (TPR) repeat protein